MGSQVALQEWYFNIRLELRLTDSSVGIPVAIAVKDQADGETSVEMPWE
jgi:hypothetical protein